VARKLVGKALAPAGAARSGMPQRKDLAELSIHLSRPLYIIEVPTILRFFAKQRRTILSKLLSVHAQDALRFPFSNVNSTTRLADRPVQTKRTARKMSKSVEATAQADCVD